MAKKIDLSTKEMELIEELLLEQIMRIEDDGYRGAADHIPPMSDELENYRRVKREAEIHRLNSAWEKFHHHGD